MQGTFVRVHAMKSWSYISSHS